MVAVLSGDLNDLQTIHATCIVVAVGEVAGQAGPMPHVRRISLDGKSIWSHAYPTVAKYLLAAAAAPDDGFWLVGRNGTELRLARLDGVGTVLHIDNLTVPDGAGSTRALATPDGGAVVVHAGAAWRMDPNGKLLWQRAFTPDAATWDGGFAAGGASLRRFDATGKLVADTATPGPVIHVSALAGGGFLLSGHAKASAAGFLARTDAAGHSDCISAGD